jgi:hypothetical protein
VPAAPENAGIDRPQVTRLYQPPRPVRQIRQRPTAGARACDPPAASATGATGPTATSPAVPGSSPSRPAALGYLAHAGASSVYPLVGAAAAVLAAGIGLVLVVRKRRAARSDTLPPYGRAPLADRRSSAKCGDGTGGGPGDWRAKESGQ